MRFCNVSVLLAQQTSCNDMVLVFLRLVRAGEFKLPSRSCRQHPRSQIPVCHSSKTIHIILGQRTWYHSVPLSTFPIHGLVFINNQIRSFSAGKVAFKRYAHLVKPGQLPFVRASGSERVVLSATNWTEGFSLASHHVYSPKLSVILSEEGNDTLDDSMCPSAGSSDVQTTQWLNTFYPAVTARLNRAAQGANLTNTDTFNLISLCPFDTAARNGHQSPFCEIFDTEDFRGFEYSGDLDKFYNTGYGQELGPVQGVGYINELIARLKRTPVVDQTQTNTTLDGDPATFPLDRAIYADFSHDNQMIAIYAAMGLFKQQRSLDPLQMDPRPSRTWVASRLVPFGARMVVEKLACGNSGAEFVRILVNDAVQPLDFCGGGETCGLDAFVASQAFARNDGDGDFEKCFQ